MQSHASRHVVSERLKDLHPDLSDPFLKEIVKDEISIAHGRRGIQKLIAVLALEPSELSDDERAHALRVFIGLLTTQEHKTDAIAAGAAQPLTRLTNESQSVDVRRLSCECLASMAQVRAGRQAVVDAAGLEALTHALTTTPEAAANALRQFSASTDGAAFLSRLHDDMVPALAALIQSPSGASGVTPMACQNAAETLAGIAVNDQGVIACLTHHVPKAIVHLLDRCLSGDIKLEASMTTCAESCANCMEQLAHHAYGKTALREAGSIKQLGLMLTYCAYHQGCMRKATSALMGISVEKECKVPVVLNAGKQLVKLMQSSHDERLVSNARAVLVSASEHLEARTVVQSLLTEHDMKTMLYRGPLPNTPPDFRYHVTLPSGTRTETTTTA